MEESGAVDHEDQESVVSIPTAEELPKLKWQVAGTAAKIPGDADSTIGEVDLGMTVKDDNVLYQPTPEVGHPCSNTPVDQYPCETKCWALIGLKHH